LGHSAYKGKEAMNEEVHTPNVPKLLFPASFTRVGAQTADPTLPPAPWTICGEALITRGRVVTCNKCLVNLQRKKIVILNPGKVFLSDLFFLSYGWRLSSPRLASFCLAHAQDRSSRRGCDPEGSRRAEPHSPRRTAHVHIAIGRKSLQ
jgi:hypothetical protein